MLGWQMNTNLNSDKTTLGMSNLPSGNYFVKITIEGVAKTIKIIMQNLLFKYTTIVIFNKQNIATNHIFV